MRYIKIPPQETITAIKHTETGEPLRYGLLEFLAEHVWGDPAWRASSEANEALARVFAAFEGAEVGSTVELEGSDFEVFMPIATMQGKPIAPHLAIHFNRLMAAVFGATSKPPREG